MKSTKFRSSSHVIFVLRGVFINFDHQINNSNLISIVTINKLNMTLKK